MLLILDQEKNYKIFRTTSENDGSVKRERIGLIPKSTFEIAEDLKSSVSNEEMSELEETVTALKEGKDIRLKAKVHDFPAIAREVVEYVTSAGTPLEHRLVTSAILEAVRLIRRSERNATDKSSK